ncbi:hypothetical protein [Pseudoalteromonas denitrificans]|uniref:hypothetical protein n=1 Tax=Pseudoalteromonas denitrificans TaxID=43656 RepID=UPI000B818FFE|nr:hypothetical protein [Pseudoalteromonas denitrificans]
MKLSKRYKKLNGKVLKIIDILTKQAESALIGLPAFHIQCNLIIFREVYWSAFFESEIPLIQAQ